MVDQSRNIYVAIQSEERVDVFLPECSLLWVDDVKKHVGFVESGRRMK